ncbi:DNA cytosine methyltransferase [Agromyces cerinus]|uniref:DNA (cytosine-5-)-methyltransferase n=1 Tax=Agromyces cerinus subsp. cerinus TaxID=232089 RepID=A0A1N6F1Z6_9MICO|nr:DNA cytosine methyltransferase [Agromyces cerinus]SIN89259.1 DNA (cytosine-5)-methyltransferase 1 [Agromyces cerinus subsp. cerinus]
MIPVVDLFAGPGGLNEGFSSVGEENSKPVFNTVASFEMDKYAHQTLVLRGVYRRLKRHGEIPQSYYEYIRGSKTWAQFSSIPEIAALLEEVSAEVHQIELGPETQSLTDSLIRSALADALKDEKDDWVLIGGPPCQAYSLVGRSRRTKDKDFEKDKKHFLYREYLRIIGEFAPSIFVMENVKGLLSSTNAGSKVFELILEDLTRLKGGLEYEIRSMVVDNQSGSLRPQDFVIRAENYGIPQRRHRVILVGVRKDLADRSPTATLTARESVSVRDAIEGLPKIRSGIAPVRDNSWDYWRGVRRRMRDRVKESGVALRIANRRQVLTTGAPFLRSYIAPHDPTEYEKWILDPAIAGVTLHEARRHMEKDLERYGYLAYRAMELKRNPTLLDLPETLQPAHENVGKEDTPFLDRFRVQLWETPATTVVSHIAKDGHYYIHPDPEQMRSLTVREAARLQSFPDNYFFKGSRTQQYSQVGNAVPPLLARQIAEKVALMLGLGEGRQPADQLQAGTVGSVYEGSQLLGPAAVAPWPLSTEPRTDATSSLVTEA